VIELVEEGAGTLMTMTQTYPSQEVRDQTLNFMETQPGASGADDRLAERSWIESPTARMWTSVCSQRSP